MDYSAVWTFGDPPYSPNDGEIFTGQLLQALASNPEVFNSTVFILTYDENGGFFDHVPLPVPPPGTADEFVDGQPAGLGVRVPMIIVSPWTRGGHWRVPECSTTRRSCDFWKRGRACRSPISAPGGGRCAGT